MDKFLGILFFYVLFFNKEAQGYDKPFSIRGTYLNEKSERYLGRSISEAQMEWLKILLKDLPSPVKDRPLSNEDVFTLIETFDKVFHIKDTQYELRMYGIEYDDEMEIINECYDDLGKFISIIGSSNGVSLIIGDWLEKTHFDRQLIEREMNLIELDI
tara:strand:- start:2571 stop:3044 length:474 start_codon:yes stop_codon:yes gene_type:complete